MDKFLVLQIDGGVGKNVVATSVVRALNGSHPDRKIIIVTAYPDIWVNNQRVYKVYRFGSISYFHRDIIEDKDTLLFIQDPYKTTDYIYRKKHLSEIWCDLCGVEWLGEKPEMYFSQLEAEFVSNIIKKEKPIFLINTFGGSDSQKHKYSWARDVYPSIVQGVVDKYKSEYRIIQVRREDQIPINGVEYFTGSLREIALLLLLSDKRLLIDSYLQHVAAALNLQSTVLWVVNSPKVLGYELHNNIIGEFVPGDTINSVYEKYDIIGDPIQLASNPSAIFNIDDILKTF